MKLRARSLIVIPIIAGFSATAIAPAASAGVVVPAAPSGIVTRDNHDGTVTVSWAARPNITEFHVRYPSLVKSIRLAGNATSYTTPQLSFGTTLRFSLAAGNAAGWSPSAYSSYVQVTPRPSLIVGSFTNTTVGSTSQSFLNERAAIPGLHVRRAFNSGIPTSIASTEAAGDAAAGIVTFLSVKPSFTAVGSDNARIASLAKSMPAGSYLTAWHEPENDMSAAQYVAMFRNFYQVAKAANPSLYVGNVYMTYCWGAGRRVPTPDAWWVGSSFTDFLGTDTYMDVWQRDSAGNPKPLGADPDHLRWHNWAVTKGKPLLLTESGVGQGFSDAQRAAYYSTSVSWLKAQGYRMFLPWNGAGTPPTGQSWDFWGGARSWPLTVAAIRAAAGGGQPDAKL